MTRPSLRSASSTTLSLIAAACVACLTASRTAAQTPVPMGGQFQVNSYTWLIQNHPAIAVTVDGSFVVAWQSFGSSGADQDSSGILAQRYDSDGSPVGEEFQVNAYTWSFQSSSSVVAQPNGDFVVVWDSGLSATDASRTSIHGQRYASDGSRLGDQFQVNTYTTSFQERPTVGAAADGDFVVVWDSYGSFGTDTDSSSIQGQRYASDGSRVGSQFQVNTFTASRQRNSSVAVSPNGDFAVVWESYDSSGTAGGLIGIQGQRYTSDGSAVGGEFQINADATPGNLPGVAADQEGDFVVVWEGYGSSGTDTTSSSVQGRRFASDGSAVGQQFQVNTYTTHFQRTPAVAALSDGEFVVAWESYGSSGTDTWYASIQGRRYASDGSPVGEEFQVNTYTTSGQYSPSVASGSDGDFTVVWSSDGSYGTDTISSSIQGQRFGRLLNRSPMAKCGDARVPAGSGTCSASVSVDAGSSDPDGDPMTLEQDPPGPYPPGETTVTLTASDPDGASSSCQAVVTVVDDEVPEIACNAPARTLRPATPISFTATAVDNCSAASVAVVDFDCLALTKKGRRVERRCDVTTSGDTITVLRAGRVCNHVQWTVLATDASGNESSATCEVVVAKKDKKRRRPYHCPPSIR